MLDPQKRNGRVQRAARGYPAGRRWRHPRDRGVSDIIGTILILAITVTLFAGLFYFVTSLPPPPAQSTSQFNAQLQLSANGQYETGINISYLAGPLLTSGSVEIFLTSTLHPSAFSCPTGNPFTISSGLSGATTWASGQTWSLPFTSSTLCPTSGVSYPLSAPGDNITVTIVNFQKDVTLFQVTLPGSHAVFPPQFVSEGTVPASPVVGSPFEIFAQVEGSQVNRNSVYANLSSLCGATLAGCPYARAVSMTYNPTQGLYFFNVSQASALFEVPGTNYPIVINASNTGAHPQQNSVVFYATFVSSVLYPLLNVTISLSDGTPHVDETVTVTATVRNENQVAGTGLVVNFSAVLNGQSTPLGTPVTLAGIGPDGSQTAQVTWAPAVSGDYTLYAGAVLQQPSQTPPALGTLGVTVFPRTLLIDEDGVSQGSNASLDTYTYVATDFTSAGIPFTSTEVAPGTSVISYSGTTVDSLDMYDVVVWVLSNGATLQASDVSAICQALANKVSVWLIGSGALGGTNTTSTSCNGSTGGIFGEFGVQPGSLTPQNLALLAPPEVPLVLSPPVPNGIPDNGIDPTNLTLWDNLGGLPSQPHYETFSPTPGAHPYLTLSAGGGRPNPAASVMAFNQPAGQGNAVVTTLELATISQTMPGTGSQLFTSTAQQASIVYNVFNWMANLIGPNARHSNDWGVSQVIIEPAQLSFNHPAFVNFTIRNNGPAVATITATLFVNGFPALSTSGGILSLQARPGALGGEDNLTLTWVPNFVGYLTLGIQLTVPSTDSDPQNNFMGNSLFSQQLYVEFSVLLVDATGGVRPDTTPEIYSALNATGFQTGTVSFVGLSHSCSPLPGPVATKVLANQYNMIVWNAGSVVNTSSTCALAQTNALTLTSFLNGGGGRASLLFIGNGLLTELPRNAVVASFVSTYLGIRSASGVTSLGPVNSPLYGMIGDTLGDGVSLTLSPGNGQNLSIPTSDLDPASNSIVVSSAFEFNSADFWNPSGEVAAVDSYSPVSHWHTAWWGFPVASVSSPASLDLVLLRTATDFGRLLPQPDAVVGAPDITFATSQSPFTNFDQMTPEIDQQYLIRANLTNLGGGYAPNVGIEIFDGSHILGVQTLTIGGSFVSPNGSVSPGLAQVSATWTPLYAGVNPITVVITSSEAGFTLPGVADQASWNVTVYFFYDNTVNNDQHWTHDQLSMWEDPESPMDLNCKANNVTVPCTTTFPPGGPPSGQYCITTSISPTAIYYTDDQSLSAIWPLAQTALQNNEGASNVCDYGSTYGSAKWGMAVGTCYVFDQYCASLAIKDYNPNGGNNNQGAVIWTYSSPVYIPSQAPYSLVTWDQEYNLALAMDGGVVCVVPVGSSCPQSLPNRQVLTPDPGYTGTVDYGACNNAVSAFTGSTPGWQYEQLNVSQFRGQTIQVGFGYIQGGCTTSPIGTAWYIDQLKVRTSGPSQSVQPVLWEHLGCPNYGFGGVPSGTCAGETPGYDVSPDYWHIENAIQIAAQGFAPPPAPLQGAWVDAGAYSGPGCNAPSGVCLSLGPSMWDSLYTPPIDLANAINASLTFNYLWARQTGPMDPSMALEVQVSPYLASGVRQWAVVYAADEYSTTNWYNHWFTNIHVDLSSFVGQVVVIRFLTVTAQGSDCGCDTAAYFPTEDPVSGVTSTGMSAAMIAGVSVGGNTTISAGSADSGMGDVNAVAGPSGPAPTAPTSSPATYPPPSPHHNGPVLPSPKTGLARESGGSWANSPGSLIATPLATSITTVTARRLPPPSRGGKGPRILSPASTGK
jgi:flagellin-like protein